MTPAHPSRPTLAQLDTRQLRHALSQASLRLDFGLVSMRLVSAARSLLGPLRSVYRHFDAHADDAEWADLHVNMAPVSGLRRWARPQVRFIADGTVPFEPFPADHALPLLEWGANWLIARRMNNVLLLHAGVLERDGLALVLPALSGSGKSTLTAALSLRGWRLLSDEFGAFDPACGGFRAVLKPVALKNSSIDVIRRFEACAELGPEFPRTRKGTVAHLAPTAASVAGMHNLAWPGAIVMPRWRAGSPTVLAPAPARMAFSSLAFNAFNYAVMGSVGFRSVVSLVRRCPAWHLVYSDLDDAIVTLERAWRDVQARHADAVEGTRCPAARRHEELAS